MLLVLDTSRTSAGRVDDVPRLDSAMDAGLLLAALASRAGDSVELGENYRAKVVSVANKRVKEVLITPTTQEAAREDRPGVG